MFKFLRNLGLGKRTPPPTPTFTAEEVGAIGPGMMDTRPAVGPGWAPYDPQFGAVGPEEKKKWKKPSAEQAMGAFAGLAKPPDVAQGMPMPPPFRLTGGSLGRYS